MGLVTMARSTFAALVLFVPACSSPDEGRLVVFAASSLTGVFDQLAAEFEATHPGADVVVSYGGSPSLVAQLADGAPVDVLATADIDTMRRAERDGSLAASPQVFATNSLVIAVEPGNPLGITTVDDLAGDVVVVLAAPEVPAGAYARQVFERAGVVVEAASLESNVRAVAGKVALGEADAALVYRTDITDDLDAIGLPEELAVLAEYPLAPTSDDPLAAEFVAFVLGPDGADVLTDAGFGAP